jgi:hypothetical protein
MSARAGSVKHCRLSLRERTIFRGAKGDNKAIFRGAKDDSPDYFTTPFFFKNAIISALNSVGFSIMRKWPTPSIV